MKHTLPRITLLTDAVVRRFMCRGVVALLVLYAGLASAQQVTITAVTPNPVCAGSAINVTYTYPLPESGTAFLYLNGPNTTNVFIGQAATSGGNGSVAGAIPANRPTGSYTVFVRRVSSVFGTVDSPNSTAFTVNAQPTAPVVANLAYCLGTTGVPPLTATGQNLKWYAASTGGVGSTASPTPPTSTAGTTNYYVSQTINGCEGLRAAIAVTVNPLPARPTVVSSLSYCQNTTAPSLAGAVTSGSNLKWYTSLTSGSGSTVAPTPPTSTVTATTYYVSQTNGNGCESDRADITVTIRAAPAPPTVTTPVTYCQDQTATALSATPTTGGTLNWFGPSNNALGSTPPTPPTTAPGTTFYTVSQTAGGCMSTAATITVTINAKPAAPTTRTVSVCQGTSPVSLAAGVTSGTNLRWYTTATGGTASTVAPAPQTTSIGSTPYYVSQTNGNGCESDRAVITYTVNAYPNPPSVVSPVAYCQNTTASPLQATASPGGTLNFYTVTTGGVPSIALIPSTQASNNYYVSQTVNGCEGQRAVISVVINALPPKPAVNTPITYCQFATAVPLSATASTNFVLSWYGIGATGGTASTVAPTPPTTTGGTFTYYVRQKDPTGCESDRASIAVTVSPQPAAPVVTPASACLNSVPAPLIQAVNATGTLKWYTAPTGGTGSTVAPIVSTASVGSTTYYVSQTNGGGCESDRSAITFTVNPQPTRPVPTPAALLYCQNAPAQALAATGQNLKWYSAASAGTPLANPVIPSTSLVGPVTYYVSQTDGNGCESARTSVVVTTVSRPAAPTVSTLPVTYCRYAAPVSLTATPITGNTLNWYGASETGGTASSTAPVPTTDPPGTTRYYVSQTDGNGCESARASIAVTVNPLPDAPVTTPVGVCQNAPAVDLSATVVASGTLTWYAAPTGGTGSVTAPVLPTSTPGTFTYYVSQTNGNGCESARATVTATVRPQPAAPLVSQAPVVYCQGAIASPLTATATAPNGILNWYTQAVGGTPSPVYPTPSTAESEPPTRYYYVSQSSNGCEGPRATIAVTIRPAVAVSIVGLPGRLGQCAAPITLVGSPAGGTFTIDGTPVTQLIPGSLAAGPHSVVYQYVSAGGCTATATGSIIIDPLPVATLVNSGPLSCTNGVVTLAAGENGFGVSFRFSTGATQLATKSLATVQTAGVYSVTVTAPSGCSAVAQTIVTSETALSAPTLQASAPATDNQPISVTAIGCSGAINWVVQGGSGQPSGAIYTVTQPGTYTISARCSAGSCTSVDATPVIVTIRSGAFAITGVTTQQCQLVNATRGEFLVTFIPQYSGLTGSPVSLAVVNEVAATTAPGPYTIRLFTDNPVVTLAATQAGSAEVRYTYNWRAACIGNVSPNRPPVAAAIPAQPLIQNQPYQLVLTSYFADPDGQPLTFSASGLPAGIVLAGSQLSGSPTGIGSVSAVVTATDPNGLQASTGIVFSISPSVVPPTPPPTVGFAITGVTPFSCVSVSSSQRRISFSPVYSGINGQAIRFRVVNESGETTASGPYSLQLYIDNPTITLEAVQSGVTATYRYNWLAGCTGQPTTPPAPGNRAPVVGLPLAPQTATVGQAYALTIPAGTFSDPDGDVLMVSATGLPAGLSFSASLSAITGTPVQAGTSMIQLTATDPGGLSVNTLVTLAVVATTVPPTAGFAITAVTTVRCEVLSASERRVTFTPTYIGTNGAAISLGVVNELAATTSPGPYSIQLYTDNPAVTLRAEQGGAVSTYRYEWLKGCTANSRQGVAETRVPLQVTVLGNPVVGPSAEVEIQGAEGQAVQVQLVDLLGYPVHQQQIRQAAGVERLSLPLGNRQGILLLKVNTATQQQQIKLLRP